MLYGDTILNFKCHINISMKNYLQLSNFKLCDYLQIDKVVFEFMLSIKNFVLQQNLEKKQTFHFIGQLFCCSCNYACPRAEDIFLISILFGQFLHF